jgi:ribose transport system substrate-binding protein
VMPGLSRRAAPALLTIVLASAVQTASADSWKIGLSMHFMRDDYAVKLAATVEATAAAERAGTDVLVADANADAAKQLADIENLVVQGVDALIIVPIDEKAVLPGIRRANSAGIPVIAVTRIPGAQVLTTIAPNGDYANGKASGDLLREKTGGRGKIALIGIPYNLWRIDERERGFHDAIEGSDLVVVTRQSGLDQAKIQDLVAGVLVANPDLAGIWCTFSNQVVGAADALRMANRHDVVLTGIDADRAIIERIRSGWVTGTAAQFPAVQGRLAAEAALRHLQGEPVAEAYDVPIALVTADNAAQMADEIWGE